MSYVYGLSMSYVYTVDPSIWSEYELRIQWTPLYGLSMSYVYTVDPSIQDVHSEIRTPQ